MVCAYHEYRLHSRPKTTSLDSDSYLFETVKKQFTDCFTSDVRCLLVFRLAILKDAVSLLFLSLPTPTNKYKYSDQSGLSLINVALRIGGTGTSKISSSDVNL